MRYFLDTEFFEDGYKRIDLISIGLVCEDGREFYAVATDGWEPVLCSEWLHENVLPHLGGPWMSREQIKQKVTDFVGHYGQTDKIEFWGYYSDYDWVLFCQLFGRMIDLPKFFPMFCRDIKQTAVELGNPQLPKQEGKEHNALDDARHIKQMHEFLLKLKAR